MDELRLAFRRLRKRPAATLASVATLGAAIGAAVAMWTILNALLLKPLPVKDSASLAVVVAQNSRGAQEGFRFSRYDDIRSEGAFAAVTGWGSWDVQVDDPAGGRLRPVHFVDATYFDVLGVPLPSGRSFSSEDDRAHGALVAILTDQYWDRAFQRSPDAVGSTITLGGKPATIIGIAPRGFRGLDLSNPADLFLPLQVIEDVVASGNFLERERAKGFSPTAWVRIVGRRAPDTAASDLAARLNAQMQGGRVSGEILAALPLDVAALPLAHRAAMLRFARLLAITVALLAMIGCGTAALLMLVRTEGRRLEFATCLALGASRARLVRGVAIEGLVLSAAGGTIALPVAHTIFGMLESFSLPGGVAIGELGLRVGATAFVAASVCALFAFAVIVLIVALGLSPDMMGMLRSHAGGVRAGRPRVRSALIVIQVAGAITLLAGTALFVRSLTAAIHVNPQRDAAKIVTVHLQVNISTLQWPPERTRELYDRVAARLRGNAAVDRLSVVSWLGGMSAEGQLRIDGVPRRLPGFTEFIGVNDDYLRTMDLHVLEGRGLSENDVAGSPLVGVVSQSLARVLDGGEAVLGRRIGLFYGAPPAEVEIVGVVPDLITNVRRLEPLIVYVPAAQHPPEISKPGSIVMLASGSAEAVRRETLAAARAEGAPVAPIMRTLRDDLFNQMRPQQFGATVLGALGLIAALLTLLGLYVIAESTASQRTRELGIRAALGATRRELRALLLRDNLRLATIGAALGLAIVYAGAGTIRAFLFGVETFDPLTLTVVPSAIVALAVLVGLAPAVRASRADVAQVLRRE